MRRLPIILFALIAMVYQSCDSTLNIDKPKDYYKYIGGDGNQTAVDMVLDGDGNSYILGTTSDADLDMQLYVVMANPRGELVWSKHYGDEGDETPKDIELLDDGSLVLLGDRADGDIVIYRISTTDGSEVKPYVISGTNSVDHANTITQVEDGFIVAAYTDSVVAATGDTFKAALLYRYDVDMLPFAPGLAWDYKLASLTGSGGYDVVPIKVFQKDPTTFLIFGYTNSLAYDGTSTYSYFVLPVDEGNVTKNSLLQVPGPEATSNERLTAVQRAPVQSGGGFILVGYTTSNSATQSLYIARILQDPAAGDPTRPETFVQGNSKRIDSNSANFSDATASIYPSPKSGFFILANDGDAGENNIYLTKLENDMGQAWYRKFGGAGDDTSGAVAETGDGRIIVVGTMVLGDVKGQRKIVLMDLDSQGQFGN